jgi:hypothetical protein
LKDFGGDFWDILEIYREIIGSEKKEEKGKQELRVLREQASYENCPVNV